MTRLARILFTCTRTDCNDVSMEVYSGPKQANKEHYTINQDFTFMSLTTSSNKTELYVEALEHLLFDVLLASAGKECLIDIEQD
jgi:hypothetical protein